MRTLLQGKPYTPACATDIRKTFARERKRLAELKAAPVAAKVVTIKRGGK